MYDQYTTCLSEMAVDGEGSDVLSYNKEMDGNGKSWRYFPH